ncbi:hypothetical protein ACNQFN_18880 [Thauera butanivorans]|uniref:DUF4376 domain-containing protein n=1 Tax=Thauera butanivorans TaxID=86174 RepID=UPI003AB47A20
MSWYLRLADRTLTPQLKALLPHISNPGNLTDAELEAAGVVRAVVEQPTVKWWQRRGERVDDIDQRPAHVTWQVDELDLEEARAVAWERVKAERETRQIGPMPYVYPSGQTHHNTMTERVVRDLTASTTTAVALHAAGGAEPVMAWTVDENVTHMLTPAEMIAFGLTATQWHSAIHLQSQTLRAAIYAAETVEAVVSAAQWSDG